MAEYIEREAVLEITMQYCPDDDGSCSKACADLREMLDEIEAIPAADVVTRDCYDRLLAENDALRKERPVRNGRWIWDPDGMDWGLGAWRCSECKSKAETWWANDKKFNPLRCSGGHFCGNCGAKMDMDGDCNDAASR